ncbi:hypothetical protein P9D77_16850 [Bacillus rugosus]|nr:hypothetical protein [Bacillus rugosus]MEC1549965.1 hypothetical protein [Bacillus rugosus]
MGERKEKHHDYQMIDCRYNYQMWDALLNEAYGVLQVVSDMEAL